MKKVVSLILALVLICTTLFGLISCSRSDRNVDELNEQIADLTKQINDANSKISALEAEKVSQSAEIVTLKVDVKVLEAEKATLEANMATLEVGKALLEKEVSDLEAEIARLQALMDDNSSAFLDEIKELEAKIDSLEAEISTLKSANTNLESQITTLNAQIIDLNLEKSTITDRIAELEASVAAKNNEIATLNSTLFELTAEKNALVAENNELKEENKELQDLVVALCNCVKDMHIYVYGFCSTCGKEAPTYTRDGDYIYFGEYPQTIKSDDVLITEMQDARGYYLGSDGYYYAKVTTRDYSSGYKFSNGSYVKRETTYYFKVEPIRWRIISEENGEAFLLCDNIIERHRFDNGSNNYAESEIRSWLNSTFYETAFSEKAKALILTTEVDNSLESTGNSSNPNICENTNDKLFLLSFAEATNVLYGFSSNNKIGDSAKSILTSDYSRALGEMSTMPSFYGNGTWYLRSPSGSVDFNYIYCVSADGSANCVSGIPNNQGVVPALRITL